MQLRSQHLWRARNGLPETPEAEHPGLPVTDTTPIDTMPSSPNRTRSPPRTKRSSKETRTNVASQPSSEISTSVAAAGGKRTTLAEAYDLVLVVLCWVLGLGSAFFTSDITYWIIDWTMPHADFFWALRAIAAALRMAYVGAVLLRVAPHHPIAALVLKFAAMGTIELNALLPQPIFFTFTGGPFRMGDASRAAIARLGRSAWASTAGIDFRRVAMCLAVETLFRWSSRLAPLITRFFNVPREKTERALLGAFGLAYAVVAADLMMCGSAGALVMAVAALITLAERSGLTRSAPSYVRLPVLVAGRIASGVFWAVFGARMWTALFWLVSGLHLPDYFSRLPSWVTYGRQELSVFRWSFSFPASWLLIVGDVLMSNPMVPAPAGVLGSALLGGALWVSGVAPSAGFYLNATAWCATAAVDAHNKWTDGAGPKRYGSEGRHGFIDFFPGRVTGRSSDTYITLRLPRWGLISSRSLAQIVVYTLLLLACSDLIMLGIRAFFDVFLFLLA